MLHNSIIFTLADNRTTFEQMLRDQPREFVYWKPDSERWCLLEIVCHLLDEEVRDFRTRTQHILEHPELPLPGIDPGAWVHNHGYMQQSFDNVLTGFLEERLLSVEWLQSIKAPNWENSHLHPVLGRMSAHKMLTNWLAHDYLHMRQITRLKYDYLAHVTGDSLSYAGEW